MRQLLLPAVLVAINAGCQEQPRHEVGETPPPEVHTTATLSGAEAYAQYCASCHTDGVDGAPRLGVIEDWGGRSQLWQAVLFEHAKAGYLSMPAKGGAAEAAEREVAAAAEYLLEETFGDRPVD